MNSLLLILVVIGAAFLLSLAYLAFALIRAARRARGVRVVICPETVTPEAVQVGGLRTAWTTLAGDPQLRLTSCSRWPEHADCGQKCLSQIEAASDGCLVHARVAQWYEDSICGACGKPTGGVRFNEQSMVIAPGQRFRQWKDITLEDLPDVFAVYKPVCPDCQASPQRLSARPKERRSGSAA